MKRKLPEAAKKYQFKPGQSGNPGGRPSHPLTKILKEITKESFAEIVHEILAGNIDNLVKIAQDPNASALEAGVARAYVVAYRKGDYSVMERIVERVTGKIPDEILVKSKNLNVNATTEVVDKAALKKALAKLENDV